MKWIRYVILILVDIMEKFMNIGSNAVNKYSNLLHIFGKRFDADLKVFILDAYILVDSKGRKQIHVLTVNGWEMVDHSDIVVSELSILLNKNIMEVGLDDVAEMNVVLQDSINNIIIQAGKSLSNSIRKLRK